MRVCCERTRPSAARAQRTACDVCENACEVSTVQQKGQEPPDEAHTQARRRQKTLLCEEHGSTFTPAPGAGEMSEARSKPARWTTGPHAENSFAFGTGWSADGRSSTVAPSAALSCLPRSRRGRCNAYTKDRTAVPVHSKAGMRGKQMMLRERTNVSLKPEVGVMLQNGRATHRVMPKTTRLNPDKNLRQVLAAGKSNTQLNPVRHLWGQTLRIHQSQAVSPVSSVRSTNDNSQSGAPFEWQPR